MVCHSQTERAESRACSPPVPLSVCPKLPIKGSGQKQSTTQGIRCHLEHSAGSLSHFVVKTTQPACLPDTDMDFMSSFLNHSSHESPCTYCRIVTPYPCSLQVATQHTAVCLREGVLSIVVFKCNPTGPYNSWSECYMALDCMVLGFHIHTMVGFGCVTHLKRVQLVVQQR